MELKKTFYQGKIITTKDRVLGKVVDIISDPVHAKYPMLVIDVNPQAMALFKPNQFKLLPASYVYELGETLVVRSDVSPFIKFPKLKETEIDSNNDFLKLQVIEHFGTPDTWGVVS
ncbi:hypothetical protein [Pararhodonellum marinum]|uniref:hypothetical protein n=1 Tax=Pararhodonellum marinum TaxID=2755358 RepID=UPI00188F5145|nr:hypothetical protein [Pararhodonellum marinum]